MVKRHEVTSISEFETMRLGEMLGEHLFDGAFIALFGELGAGKTSLTKGIANALGVEGIQSPTFTIVREHDGLLHFDAYRLADAQELYDIGFEDYLASLTPIVMEWPQNVKEALPKERLNIYIEGSGTDPRKIVLVANGAKYEEMLEEAIAR